MTRTLPLLEDFASAASGRGEEGFGALSTSRGHLPLKAMSIEGRIDGLLSRVTLRQTFVNVTDVPLEATYIFPLPDRAAVTGFLMEVGGRVIEGDLEERAKARRDYEMAIHQGRRASIAEEDRPGVFTLRVGNVMPGEEAVIRFTMVGVLPYQDGEVTFRFPLVIAPRYIPGLQLPGPSVGDGVAVDTDAVPDASRISPPVLLPGFPNPVRLSLTVDVQGWGGVVDGLRASLHATTTEEFDGACRVQLLPGERLDRDFVLRFRLGGAGIQSALTLHPDNAGGGTFALTVLPPTDVPDGSPRPRAVMFVLDRSGSMEGWKIVAARRAMASMIDSLVEADRFGVIAFAGSMRTPDGIRSLVAASDRNRFTAVEFLADLDASGGTEMAQPLMAAADALARTGSRMDRTLVLVTDGQVGNEDQILRSLAPLLDGVRVFTLGIDLAVNGGFLHRLAECGGGCCELVESEDRLDEVLDSIRRRLGAPVLSDLKLQASGVEIEPDSLVPSGRLHLFPGVPALVLGRYRGRPGGSMEVSARDAAGRTWDQTLPATVRPNPAVASAWARGRLRSLEDRFATGREDNAALERTIVETSLRHGVLCRFTAYVAIDRSRVANEGGEVLRITQPVELPEEAIVIGAVRSMTYCSPEASDARLGSAASTLKAFGLRETRRGELFSGTVPAEVDACFLLDVRGSDSTDYVVASRMLGPETTPSSLGAGDSSPSVLDRFERVEVLAHGGLGTTYKGYDRSRCCEVLIRQIPRGAADPSRTISLDRARELARLAHPGILPLHDVIREGETLFIVSQYLPWPTLESLLGPGRPLDPERAADIVARLADILQYCHDRGVTHGDVKPSNILIGDDGSVRLTGFVLPLPQAGEIQGTAAYMAPEAFALAPGDHKPAEVYALGVILYRMLTGELPFKGERGRMLMQQIIGGVARPPSAINPAIPSWLEAICLKAMATKPEDRYPGAKELADALRPVVPVASRPGLLQRARQFFTSGNATDPSQRVRRESFWK